MSCASQPSNCWDLGHHMMLVQIHVSGLQVDMLVGDIYGDRDYSSIGLSATTIASSFGKVVSQVSAPGVLSSPPLVVLWQLAARACLPTTRVLVFPCKATPLGSFWDVCRLGSRG